VPTEVLVHRFDSPEGALLFLHNLGKKKLKIDLGRLPEQSDDMHEVLADREYEPPPADLKGLDLAPYGYRWIRLCHNVRDFSARATARPADG